MRFVKQLPALLIIGFALSCEGDSAGELSGAGQGGSMTRFALGANHLYLLDSTTIKVYNVAQGAFEQIGNVSVGWGMETIFAKGEYLYLGANDAMYIYSIANPAAPDFVFRYQHIVACDPVVVQGNRAYVTMRSGNGCNRGTNALEIIDISNPYYPVLVKNYPMSSPHGLGIDGNLLFLCEGAGGLKVWDVTDERSIALIDHRDDFFAYDVIARNGVATVTGADGIFQFSYAPAEKEIGLLSKIPVGAL